ncbi:hypothetical protein KGY14_10940 [Ameyamaea chiangmaiensis]|uniref:Lipoprotein n=1 Tax=Ameyamaea chiangmaiensis TaxID=442969 RepID=A0A850PI85_9PROT|nr:hypothetical protein [Ameyamaea chiangmaiensis]MBS4075707.1 hypothetical protein [Ameyamaea chiangmaiensis]NVN42110.1 hypothetical protein [Ameyamaea chiangmaiensis]
MRGDRIRGARRVRGAVLGCTMVLAALAGCSNPNTPRREATRYQHQITTCSAGSGNRTVRGRCYLRAMRAHYLWTKAHPTAAKAQR